MKFTIKKVVVTLSDKEKEIIAMMIFASVFLGFGYLLGSIHYFP